MVGMVGWMVISVMEISSVPIVQTGEVTILSPSAWVTLT